MLRQKRLLADPCREGERVAMQFKLHHSWIHNVANLDGVRTGIQPAIAPYYTRDYYEKSAEIVTRIDHAFVYGGERADGVGEEQRLGLAGLQRQARKVEQRLQWKGLQ